MDKKCIYCNSELTETNDEYVCENCGYTLKKEILDVNNTNVVENTKPNLSMKKGIITLVLSIIFSCIILISLYYSMSIAFVDLKYDSNNAANVFGVAISGILLFIIMLSSCLFGIILSIILLAINIITKVSLRKKENTISNLIFIIFSSISIVLFISCIIIFINFGLPN